jgi:hypothetical protein
MVSKVGGIANAGENDFPVGLLFPAPQFLSTGVFPIWGKIPDKGAKAKVHPRGVRNETVRNPLANRAFNWENLTRLSFPIWEPSSVFSNH